VQPSSIINVHDEVGFLTEQGRKLAITALRFARHKLWAELLEASGGRREAAQ
jgi:hypothetical protein